MKQLPIIALLTDFGTVDWYVASLRGVLVSRAPKARIIDITHEIPPYDVIAAALTLSACVEFFPRKTVFLVVVDPAVGTRRSLLAMEVNGRFFVGPDNGLLSPVASSAKRYAAVHLTKPSFWLKPVSRTFHGRDILAPVAAYLAKGGALSRLGTVARHLHPSPIPPCHSYPKRQEGSIVHIDRFGNLLTNIPATKKPVAVLFRQRRLPVVSSYATAPKGKLVALVGSLGMWELAVREESAAASFRIKPGEAVILRS
ncbi:MAG: SAM-dependent chlorinase/fluorinase [Candidatus Omnitrophica bacterium]|nr:SAM-dependent chlorinase/fluorinase [Candidatus Omnitrophota bacterium]MBI2174129.1 SAM-dependent chlorinase/fluorinase [Candidatus Omnitrophota bacterium]MBI3010443.1 SAM-dependent chlorinase/fluorinase [Candidatus Omnitrophota bacterium]